jgi:hypothetical protein
VYIIFLLVLFILIYALFGKELYASKFNIQANRDSSIRHNFDTFIQSFLTVFQVMTMENWQDILYLALNSGVNKGVTLLYLITWIWMGNFLLLNLFLAILIDGFLSKPEKDEDDIFYGEEDQECMTVRLKKKRDLEERKRKEEELALLRENSEEDFFATI